MINDSNFGVKFGWAECFSASCPVGGSSPFDENLLVGASFSANQICPKEKLGQLIYILIPDH